MLNFFIILIFSMIVISIILEFYNRTFGRYLANKKLKIYCKVLEKYNKPNRKRNDFI